MKTAGLTKIALTGGPCAGKTTILAQIVAHFSELGYRVVVVPESATLVIGAEFKPGEFPDERPFHFQEAVYGIQHSLETNLEQLSRNCAEPVLMVCDRGIMDSKAYCSPEIWQRVLTRNKVTEAECRDARYHSVIHLVTAADGAEAFYTTANNAARSEDMATARAVDRRLRNAWTGHPHYRIVDNSTDFAGKVRRTLAVISNVLGIPEPLEIERKFVLPGLPDFPAEIAVVTSTISQIYLTNAEAGERIRAREYHGYVVYSHTIKQTISAQERIETERMITRDEYMELLSRRDPTRGEVRKKRHCFVWNKHQFEIDEYLGALQGRVVAEVETDAVDEVVELPEFLHIVEEVTGQEAWSNSSLAKLAATK